MKMTEKVEKNVVETKRESGPKKKEICGMWYEVVIPYMVKSGRSDQLDQWERDWYEENIRRKSGNA